MRPGKSYEKHINFIICLARSSQNHVYSPCRERPPVLRDHKIKWSLYTGFTAPWKDSLYTEMRTCPSEPKHPCSQSAQLPYTPAGSHGVSTLSGQGVGVAARLTPHGQKLERVWSRADVAGNEAHFASDALLQVYAAHWLLWRDTIRCCYNYLVITNFSPKRIKIQYSAVITQSIFTQILTKDRPQIARKGEIWSVFCEYNLKCTFSLSLLYHIWKTMLCWTLL